MGQRERKRERERVRERERDRILDFYINKCYIVAETMVEYAC